MEQNNSLLSFNEISQRLQPMKLNYVSEKTGVSLHYLNKLKNSKADDKTPVGVIKAVSDFLQG